MTNFLKNYIKEVEVSLNGNKKLDWKKVLERHLEVVGFMQHERLIHLLVTLFFGSNFILVTMFLLINPSVVLLVVNFLLLVLLIPYVGHYFKLENGVQKLYRISEEIRKKI